MDSIRVYRAWITRRLLLLGSSFLTSVAAVLWLAIEAPFPIWIRVSCLSIAAISAGLLGFILFETLLCHRLHREKRLEEARNLRRVLQPYRGLAALILLLVGSLTIVPGLLRQPRSQSRLLTLSPRSSPTSPTLGREIASRPPSPELGSTEPRREASLPETPKPPELPASPEPQPTPIPEPVKTEPASRPEPILALDLKPLELSERDLFFPAWADPYPKSLKEDPPLAQRQDEEDRRLPEFREDPEAYRSLPLSPGRTAERPTRAMPDESDLDGWPSPEVRLEGMLLLGQAHERIPAISFDIDIPTDQSGSVVLGWLALDLPHPQGTEGFRHDLPDWEHATLAYMLRLAGYTRHAIIDFAVSLGMSADLPGKIRDLPLADHDPKFAPYAAVDFAAWQDGALGLLVHLGESVPVRIGGTSIGVTDLSATLRLDVTANFSLHAGYRVISYRLRESTTSLPGGASNETLAESFSGPLAGLDVRF